MIWLKRSGDILLMMMLILSSNMARWESASYRFVRVGVLHLSVSFITVCTWHISWHLHFVVRLRPSPVRSNCEADLWGWRLGDLCARINIAYSSRDESRTSLAAWWRSPVFSGSTPSCEWVFSNISRLLKRTSWQTMGRHSDLSQKRLHATALTKLSKASGCYPECLRLEGIRMKGEHAVASGGFGDVWRGKHRGQNIAIKMLRIYQDSDLLKLNRVQSIYYFLVEHNLKIASGILTWSRFMAATLSS